MKITPLEIKNHTLKRSFLGYDRREAEALREVAAEALEESNRERTRLEERLKDTETRLSEHMQNESVLRDSITTAQRMVDDIKVNARKEAELIAAEARIQADGIVRQAQTRARELREDILRLRQQRIEMETSIRALIDYHSTKLLFEEDEAKKSDEDAEKVKFIK